MSQNVLAVIPARGGSKRLPRKNILPFRGRPMLAWTVAAALQTQRFARVVVSTDDPEIAVAGQEAGAEHADRGAELSGDAARVTDVCLDLLNRESAAGRNYDVLCVLYPTAPMRGAEDIIAVLDLLKPGDVDHALAVTEYGLPPHQALRWSEDGPMTAMWPDLVAARASDVGPLVVDNGSTYAVRVSRFLAEPGFYGDTLKGHRMSREKSVDLDYPEDLELLEFYAERTGFGRAV